ncbi:PAS domain-containing hybrid sensor histidine kinase/response regulator [Pseudomonas protegens]|uniref:PAS domain-containing hybrid sensor histidine kinase/response regulator n=1 Tax=Pseudomonas protegens TaxID=380021 RepID=UPI002772440B|nr:PAS domain S-box protein [Pseudomonas protegens]MDP9528665.1 PAS domain S-box protein [Pseudomonas protegens]
MGLVYLALISVLGISTTAAVYWLVARVNAHQLEQAVSRAADDATRHVLERMTLYQYGLRGARGVIVTAGEDGVTRELFHRYSQSRDLNREFFGAHGFGFVRRVPEARERAFLAAAQLDGAPGFNLQQWQPHHGDRYVVQYIEPLAPNQSALGLDLASEPVRRAAAVAAMLSGEPRLTGPLSLRQEPGVVMGSLLFLLPVYRSAEVPPSPQQREAQTLGWTYAPLVMHEVLKDLPVDPASQRLVLRDISDSADASSFFASSAEPLKNTLSVRTREEQVFGRRWAFEFSVGPGFVEPLHQTSLAGVLWVGGLLTLLLAVVGSVIALGVNRQHRLRRDQTRLAAIVESSTDGIIGKTLEGRITSWNRGAEEMFGYSADQALGRLLLDLIVPPELAQEEQHILRKVRDGERVHSFDTQRLRRDGSRVEVSVNVSPILDERGQVIGASKTVRDITAQKAAEARILELNASLEDQVAARTAELGQTNLLLSSVLRSASEVAIIATDREGIIRVFNRGAERLLGYLAEELVGLYTPAVIHLPEEVRQRGIELSAQHQRPIQGFRVFVEQSETEGAETREWTMVRKDGSHFAATLVVTALRDDGGQLTGYLGIAVDITERKAAEKTLAAARDQLLMAAEVAKLGIWSWNLDDHSLDWNERMFELYEQPLALRGNGLNYEHWLARVHPDDQEMTQRKLEEAVAGLGIYDPVFRVVTPGGQVRFIQSGAYVERNVDGQALRVTGINLDITAQRELESRLLYAKEQADAASEAKSSFLANMSHEIRTPMNAVLGMLQLLQRAGLEPRQLDYATKAQTAAKSLLGLLNDILDYSKIEAGKLQLEEHAFDLDQLLRDLAVVLTGNQSVGDIELIFDLDPQLPLNLVGDSLRLQQVLINLAGNALKFTAQGQVVVGLKLLELREHSVRLLVAVSDSGIGISAEHLQVIFEGFHQAEASTTRRFGGTGLGLAICRHLVRLMGGELQVRSQLDTGSCFSFELELGLDGAHVVQALPMGGKVLRVLVVDDHPQALALNVRTLRSFGWTVEQAGSGAQALLAVDAAVARGEAFDLILLDWLMPDMDGLHAAQLIKDLGLETPPTVVMLSHHDARALQARLDSAEAPFAHFLSKPFTPRQLAQLLLADDPVAIHSPPATSPVRLMALSGLRLLVVEDNALNRQIARELLTLEGAQVQLAEGGLQGVKMTLEAEEPFAAVLMDIQMPDIDGYEATRRIRADARFARLPIIAMTANASQADRQSCLKAGMDDHVGKPINLPELINSLLFWTSGAAPGMEVSGAPLESSLIEDPVRTLERFGGNRDLLNQVLLGSESALGDLLERLRQSLADNQPEQACYLLHTLKGAAGNLGGSAFALRCGELEQALRRAAPLQQILTPVELDELQQLLARTLAALQAAYGDAGAQRVGDVQEGLDPAAFHLALQEILPLLRQSNLQALNLTEALAKKRVPCPVEAFDKFVCHVRNMEFAAALNILERMLLNN